MDNIDRLLVVFHNLQKQRLKLINRIEDVREIIKQVINESKQSPAK